MRARTKISALLQETSRYKTSSQNSLVKMLEGAEKLIYQHLQKQRKVADLLENIFEKHRLLKQLYVLKKTLTLNKLKQTQ